MLDTFNGLFDEKFYLSQYADVKVAVEAGQFKNALEHYELYGRTEGREPSGYFNEQYYLSRYPDVDGAVKSGKFKDGLEHFLLYGQHFNELRSPSELVDMPALYDYAKKQDPKMADEIAKDELTGIQYLVDSPLANQYKFLSLWMIDEIWNQKNLAILDDAASNAIFYGSQTTVNQGSENFKQTAAQLLASMPDLRIGVNEEFYSSEGAVHRWNIKGTHTGAPLFGVPANGKQITMTGITTFGFDSYGHIVDSWSEFDQLGLLQQLGIIPSQ